MNIQQNSYKYVHFKVIQDYYKDICNKTMSTININIKNIQKMEKMSNENLQNLKFADYNQLIKYNYSLQQLKTMCKSHKLKVTGTKEQLLTNLYTFLYLSVYAIKIQKIMRRHLIQKWNKCHGPAFKNRALCNNVVDFLSMDELTTISPEQFFSFCDEDGFIYGFDILTLYNLIYKSVGDVVKNPYNNNIISNQVIGNVKTFLRLSKALKIKVKIHIKQIKQDIEEKTVEKRTLDLFHNINSLGNYTDSQWFLELNKEQILRFVHELLNIWNVRAGITLQVRKKICPPYGNPFIGLPPSGLLNTIENLDDIKNIVLDVLEKLVNNGINDDNKYLGAYYVLCALSLVNNNVAIALPWVYQSVCYNM
jgi:hypothetical protein